MATYLIAFSENFANKAPCGGGSCKIEAASGQTALCKFFGQYDNYTLLTLADNENEAIGLDISGLIKTDKGLFIEATAFRE